jgi:hypothetical protein
MEEPSLTALHREPWNKGKLVGQKAPLKRRDTWAIRVRLQISNCARSKPVNDHGRSLTSQFRSFEADKIFFRKQPVAPLITLVH